ncbi:hypothetical protein M2341_002072 [Sphingobium sp. B7D2B]|uniref:hypothetical protein n=1 Tax=Sphingobium sp. B7D2B TaxID=2940583 RepID=UPI002224E1C7|nr:hypothetical protein [Sphingobium sp. B7D2B]MCW2366625.1 hypothetical protein [Sphingobium sp. B7D2B]
MTTDNNHRLFSDAAPIHAIGAGLLDCTLPRERWTHEAHLAACFWLMVERPDIDLDHEIAPIIRRYNASVGVPNDDRHGYHETITRAFLGGVRLYRAEHIGGDLLNEVNGLLTSAQSARDWPLNFWSRERLFSAEARLSYTPPDLNTPALAALLPYLPREPDRA